MYNIYYSIPFKEGDGKKTSATISKRILATSVYDACKECYLDSVSSKYRTALSEKILQLIPVTNDFDELKKAYKQLDFHLEVIEIFK